jgi:hypothetical protein
VFVQAGRQGVGLSSDNLGLSVGVDAVFGLEHLLGYSDGNSDVDPVAVCVGSRKAMRAEPLLDQIVGLVIGGGELVDLFFRQLSAV